MAGVTHIKIHRGIEQLAARRAHNPEVGGSSPPPATIKNLCPDGGIGRRAGLKHQ